MALGWVRQEGTILHERLLKSSDQQGAFIAQQLQSSYRYKSNQLAGGNVKNEADSDHGYEIEVGFE